MMDMPEETECSSTFYSLLFQWISNCYNVVMMQYMEHKWWYTIIAASHELQRVLNLWQLNCLLNNFSQIDNRKHESSQSLILCGWNPLQGCPHKGPVIWKAFWCHTRWHCCSSFWLNRWAISEMIETADNWAHLSLKHGLSWCCLHF